MALLTCGAFPTEEETRRKLWIFLRSCEKFDVEPLIYGMGTPQFVGYLPMMLTMNLAYLKTIVNDYSTVCFSDGVQHA